jgi:hypothetical protein
MGKYSNPLGSFGGGHDRPDSVVRRRNTIFVVAGVALLTRLVVLALAWGRTEGGDPAVYLTLAHNLLAGQGYGLFDPTYGMQQNAMYPPLYPLLLAAIGSAAPLSQPTIFITNFAIDLAAAWIIARLASELGFKPLLAATIYLLWPSNVLFAASPQKEGLASLLAVLAALFAVRQSPARLGITAALLALTQPALATFPVIFAVLLRTHRLLVAGGAAVLVLLPWWLRNYIIFGTFVPLTTASGYSFWVGTFSPDGWWIVPPQRLRVGEELLFSKVSAADAWAWITSHPAEYAKHCLNKLARGLINGWWPVDRLTRMAPAMPWLVVFWPLTVTITSVLTALGIFGAVVTKGTVGRLLLACVLQIIFFEIWFEFSERHTYFAIPFVCLAIAAGIDTVRRDLTLGSKCHRAAAQ